MTDVTAHEEDVWDWYWRLGWRSIVLWPFALYNLGGALFSFVFMLTLNYDFMRHSFITWLICGWNAFSIVVIFPGLPYYLAICFAYRLWKWPRIQSCWALPIKLAGVFLIGLTADLTAQLAKILLIKLLDLLNVDLSTTIRLLYAVSRLGLWISAEPIP